MMMSTINKSSILRIVMSVLLVSALVFTMVPADKVDAATKKKVKLTYYANKGKFVAKKYAKKKSYSKKIIKGKKIGTLPKVKRTGYKLKGWYTKQTSGKKVTKNTKIKKSTKIFARWTAKKYTLAFNANGGKVSSTSKKVTFNKTYGKLPVPTREGYVFKGWYTAKSGGKAVTSKSKYTKAKNTTVYARWTKAARTDFPMTKAVEKMIAENKKNSFEPYAKSIMDTLTFGSNSLPTDAKTAGFRLSGSGAELAAAEWIEDEFEELGLEVEKIPVTLDKWQFNEASLKVTYNDGGSPAEINLSSEDSEIVSFAVNGTKQLTPGNPVWENLEIVDVGDGKLEDYEGLDVDGKIVMAALDIEEEYYYNTIYEEAYEQGAAAVMVYQKGSAGMFGSSDPENWDTVHVEAPCSFDRGIPFVSISPRDANKIKSALETDNLAKAELLVDNEVVQTQSGDTDPVGYHIAGTLKGSGNTGQRIIYSGHYDKFFTGFQDNSSAVGMIFGIAKAMKASGYEPVNDITFVAVCAEEWGQVGTETDWAAGTWKLMTEAKPEWSGSTLGVFNYEECTGKIGDTIGLAGTNEITAMLSGFKDANLLKSYDGSVHPTIKSPSNISAYSIVMSDAVSYQLNGVPLFSPGQGSLGDFIAGDSSREHTKYDDGRDYHAASVDYKIIQDAALGMYIDNTPALVVDMGKRVDLLTDDISLPEDPAAGKLDDYDEAAAELADAAKALKAKAEKLNADYIKAFRSDDKAAMDTIRQDAAKLNEISLKAFGDGQDDFTALYSWSGVQTPQQALMTDISILRDTIDLIEDTKYKSALYTVGELWSSNEWMAMEFSDNTYKAMVDRMNNTTLSERGENNWSTGKQSLVIDTYEATAGLMALAYKYGGNEANIVRAYGAALDTLEGEYVSAINDVISGMNSLTTFINSSL